MRMFRSTVKAVMLTTDWLVAFIEITPDNRNLMRDCRCYTEA